MYDSTTDELNDGVDIHWWQAVLNIDVDCSDCITTQVTSSTTQVILLY